MVDLRPQDKWSACKSKLLGVTTIMDFIKEYYQKEYAPNTRESIRRHTIHQFVQAGLVIPNPDKQRPTNSPQYVYEVSSTALELIKTFQTKMWRDNLKEYLSQAESLSSIYSQQRKMEKIPIQLADKKEIYLSTGRHNELIKKVIEEFCQYFVPGGKLIYVGDTQKKWAYFDERTLAKLGVSIIDPHGKMPDVVVYYKSKKWLVLIEVVTSHGPIDPKRKIELEKLFSQSNVGLVFITSFLCRKDLTKYLENIAWETDIWIADNPTHLVHLNGKRFLGPYAK